MVIKVGHGTCFDGLQLKQLCTCPRVLGCCIHGLPMCALVISVQCLTHTADASICNAACAIVYADRCKFIAYALKPEMRCKQRVAWMCNLCMVFTFIAWMCRCGSSCMLRYSSQLYFWQQQVRITYVLRYKPTPLVQPVSV